MIKWIRSLHTWCNKHEWTIFLILLTLVLRLPSFVMPHYYGDEEIYFVMGRAWATGVPLYQAMFDHKPPLIYILAGIAPTMATFRGVLALFMVVHTILFVKLAELIWAKTRPKLVYLSSFIFVLITTLPTFEGLTVNAELLMMMPVTGAVLLLWNKRADREVGPYRYLMAGLLGGIGWLFKIPVAADMVAIGLYFLVYKKATLREGLASLLSPSFWAYALAFVSPLALTFLYYYLKGTGPDYLATVLTVNLGYVSSWSTSTYTFNPFKSGLVVRGVIVAAFALWLYVVRKKLNPTLVFSSLWLSFSLFGALLSARPYPHYLQELAAPAAIFLSLIFVTENILGWITIGMIFFAGIAIQRTINFWGYPTVNVYTTYFEYVTKKISWDEYLDRFDNAKRNYAIAQYLNERLEESEKIYIWGTDPTVYNLTNRLPTGGKYIVSFHVRDLNQYDYTIANIVKESPKYIIILPGSGDFEALTSLIDEQYVLAKRLEESEIYIRMNNK